MMWNGKRFLNGSLKLIRSGSTVISDNDGCMVLANGSWKIYVPRRGENSAPVKQAFYGVMEHQGLETYFHFDYKDPSSQSLDNATRCLLKQICKLQQKLPLTLISLYRTCGKRQGLPPQSDLVQALVSSSQIFDQVFFVIDALDECESSTAEEVLTMLKALPSCAAILITSRQIGGGIREILQAWPQMEIQAQTSDLRSYILHRIATKVHGVDLNMSSLERIVEKISQNARHMFLLGVLHVEAVLSEPSIGEKLDALEVLSGSLDGAFGETMQRIRCQPQSRRRLAQKCLLWLCHARRPLKIEELRDALALMTMGRTATSLERKYRPSEATIIDSCHGLVTVEKRSEVIRLVHYSLYEYLAHDSDGSLLEDRTPEKTIAELCINYQMLDRFCYECNRKDREAAQRFLRFPFLIYAARQWVRRCP
ncbi:MAG: hypothetical protein Q9228_005796 [Teloschistes exilis]